MAGGEPKKGTKSSGEAPGITSVRTVSKVSGANALPRKIKIRREKGYHTHYIGHSKDGKQFMAFVVGIPTSKTTHTAARKVAWYAVLHRFDAQGNHMKTEALFLGNRAYASELNIDPEEKLTKIIAKLGPVKYGDVEVGLFSVRIDGHVFGLQDTSETEEGYQRIDLVPNGLAFFPPWDGTYST